MWHYDEQNSKIQYRKDVGGKWETTNYIVVTLVDFEKIKSTGEQIIALHCTWALQGIKSVSVYLSIFNSTSLRIVQQDIMHKLQLFHTLVHHW